MLSPSAIRAGVASAGSDDACACVAAAPCAPTVDAKGDAQGAAHTAAATIAATVFNRRPSEADDKAGEQSRALIREIPLGFGGHPYVPVVHPVHRKARGPVLGQQTRRSALLAEP